VAAGLFFLVWNRTTGEATAGTHAIDLADTDLNLALIRNGLLDPPAGKSVVGTAQRLEQRQGVPAEFGRMAVATLGQGRRRIGVKAVLEVDHGGAMERDKGKRLIRHEGRDNLLFGRALRDGLWFNGHTRLVDSMESRRGVSLPGVG
jgi:hypothetical protein